MSGETIPLLAYMLSRNMTLANSHCLQRHVGLERKSGVVIQPASDHGRLHSIHELFGSKKELQPSAKFSSGMWDV
jgi:hypothetical protein